MTDQFQEKRKQASKRYFDGNSHTCPTCNIKNAYRLDCDECRDRLKKTKKTKESSSK